MDITIEELSRRVEEIYEFRDNFFNVQSVEDAHLKKKLVNEKMIIVADIFENNISNFNDNPRFHLLRGKLLNVSDSYESVAENSLTKSLKLDPCQSEAWIQLGECLWRKNNYEAASNCFKKALSCSSDDVSKIISLRNLSIIGRHINLNNDRSKVLNECTKLAKDALQLDMSDGMSWYVLGNSYLSTFFHQGQKPTILSQCLSAYTKALADSKMTYDSDLYYNRAYVFKYQEEYDEALNDLAKALLYEPDNENAIAEMKNLKDYLNGIISSIETRGKIKDKVFTTKVLGTFNKKSLGGYGDGQYVNFNDVSVMLSAVSLGSLSPGVNSNKMIHLKCLCDISPSNRLPYTLLVSDSEGQLCALEIYNIVPDFHIQRFDSVVIPEPIFKKNVVNKLTDHPVSFLSIREYSPKDVLVNGRPLGNDKVSLIQLKCALKAD